jgi:hypothetical protein
MHNMLSPMSELGDKGGKNLFVSLQNPPVPTPRERLQKSDVCAQADQNGH